MKRRDLLKALFAAPVAAVATKAVAEIEPPVMLPSPEPEPEPTPEPEYRKPLTDTVRFQDFEWLKPNLDHVEYWSKQLADETMKDRPLIKRR